MVSSGFGAGIGVETGGGLGVERGGGTGLGAGVGVVAGVQAPPNRDSTSTVTSKIESLYFLTLLVSSITHCPQLCGPESIVPNLPTKVNVIAFRFQAPHYLVSQGYWLFALD